MSQALTRPEIAEVLRFYAGAGLDFAMEEVAQNLLEDTPDNIAANVLLARTDPKQADAPRIAPRPAIAAPSLAVPDDATVARAREEARLAADLDTLRERLEAFDGCALKATATKLVFADGNPRARIMFVGEAPGREEDLEGRPFVGRAGQLLDRMLKSIALDRSQVYIANVIYWRPPGNRTPTPMETEICRPFIERQIEIVKPDLLVFLGNVSTKCLLPGADGILRMRGNWTEWTSPSGKTFPVLPTLHPAYLLRQPVQKRLAWRDLLSLKERIRAAGLPDQIQHS